MAEHKKASDTVLDCWKRIGVAGDRTCPELPELGHCRNCRKYSEVGARILEREPPDGYIDMWTAMLAREKKAEASGTTSVVVFRIGGEWLALPAGVFVEVTEVRRIHSIPHRPNNVVLGLVNVRGDIQLCVSIANLLGIEKAEGNENGDADRSPVSSSRIYERMVVVERKGDRWVFAVDEFYGIHRFDPAELRNVPVTVANVKSSHTKGVLNWRERSVGCLDDELLFNSLRRSLA